MDSDHIRVLLVDDHEVVRLGLRSLLAPFPRMEIVGEAATAAAGIREAARLRPQMVLMDVRLPDGSGFEVCRELRKTSPKTRILFLTAFGDDECILQAIQAGADGFLLKEIDGAELASAIEKIHAGQSILDPAVTRRVLSQLKQAHEPTPQNKLDLLSAQERRVIALVAQGKTNKEIGTALGLSDKTVKNYLRNALEKWNMNRRSQAAAFFAQHGER